MDTKLTHALASFCLAWLVLHAPAAKAQIEARSVVIAEESGGQYNESGRYAPSPHTVQYWADPELGAIRRSRIDGTDVADVATSLHLPYGIAFDGATQELLWTSAGEEVVQKVAVHGGAPTALLTAFEEPYAIDLSNETQKVVYSSTGNVIYKDTVDLATGEETTQLLLVVVDEQPVHGLALDPAGGILYIGDANGRMTRRIDLNTHSSGHLIYSGTEPTLPPAPIPDPLPDPGPIPRDPYLAEP